MSDNTDNNSKDDIHSLKELCQDMLSKSTDYFQEEIKKNSEEYKLMEKLNNETIKYYSEMKDISTKVNSAIDKLNNKSSALKTYFQMVDQLDGSICNLEQAVYRIDSYSKKLEAKFKQLEKN